MLDPLTAFSLAASIAAFVDFAKELCSDGYAIYKSGKDLSASNADIEERLLHVQDLEASVRAKAANTYPVLSKNELKLQTLAKECQELSEKMLAVFDDLKVTSQGFRRVVAAARQSIRSRRKAKEVQTMMDKLDRLRGDVNTCLLLIIRFAVVCHVKPHKPPSMLTIKLGTTSQPRCAIFLRSSKRQKI